MTGSAQRRIMPFIVGAIAALALAACGSSSSSSSSASSSATSSGGSSTASSSSSAAASSSGGQSYLSPGPTGGGIRPGTGAYAAKSVAAGKVAAKDTGAPTTKLPTITVGVINFLNGIESSDRLADTTTYAASQLGWKTIVCDGKGTPTQFVACGDSLLNQGVKAIVAIAVEPGQMQEVLTKAKSMNVPVIQAGGGAVPLGDFAGNYGPNEQEAGKLLSNAIIQKLNPLPGNPSVVIHNFPSAWAAQRTLQFTNALKAQSKIKVAANVTTDAANLVPFTRSAVTTEITQDASAKAYWFTFDTTGQVGGGVLAAKYAGKTFPNRPIVVTFHADLGTLQLMRQGKIDMTSEANYDAAVWESLNGVAEMLARGTKIPTINQPTFPVIGDPFTYQIVDKTNLPPAGQYVQPKWDVPSYFIAKWKAEFGK